METKLNIKSCGTINDESNCLNYSSMVHSKKVVKHALRQQVKRRRKNTTIASGNSRSLPKIVHALPSTISSDLSLSGISSQQNNIVIEETAVTMKEVLASLPGFSIKSNRRRSTKRLSVAAQLEAGLVDLESPASILANTSLRALLNRHTFQGLPPLYQRKLAQLLPVVDRQDAATSGLNNEFFARACQEWRKRLAEGEFTPENQQRLKMEAEKDKSKLDPWKLKHFEPIWGEKREIHKLRSGIHCINKEQRYTKSVTRSNLRTQTESNLHSIFTDNQSPNLSLEEKTNQSELTITNNLSSESRSVSINDQRVIPDFNVSVRILEEDEDDDDNEEDDEYEDDDDDDDDDDDEDDDEDDEEDEDDDDEVETQVSLTYLDERAQHCRAIIVASANNDQLYKDQRTSTEIALNEKSKYSKGMILDFINDGKYLEIDMKVKEDPELQKQNIEKSLSSSVKDFKNFPNNNFNSKSSDCSMLGNQDQLFKLSESNLSESSIQIYEDSISKLKFTVKDESFGADIAINENATNKEKSFKDSNLCCEDNNRINCEESNNVTTGISEVIEIDNETLQRIHELEVRGEMQEAYEEISGCPEEIIYPILEDMEINSNNTKVSNTSSVSETTVNEEINNSVNTRTQEEAFQEANNYVCSEMLDCSWTSNTNENNISNDREELQVPWPLVAAALDNTVPTNITITTSNDCNNSQSFINQKIPLHQDELVNIEENSESISCIQLPVTPFRSEALRITAPVTSCLMKNAHTTQSSSIITFPQLQSIRFVQTNFQTTIEHSSSENIPNTASLCTQIQTSTHEPQNNLSNAVQSTALCKNQKDIHHEFDVENEYQDQLQNALSQTAIQHQNMQTQSTIVLQQQTLLPLPSRQIITTLQPNQQSHYPMIMNVQSKGNRNTGMQNTHRSVRSGNRDQNNGRSRNVTKEPPGAVNLERSYQICQAVIASSPNRDQLKAHLKPPPSLLTKSEKLIINNKFSTRNSNPIKAHKSINQDPSLISTKSQGVVLKHIFANAHQNCLEEISENQTEYDNHGEIGQYIFVKRTGNENTPRASSAPPMPPQIAGMSIGVHMVHGRPASAGENSHQAISLRNKGNNFRSGGAEPNTPSIIIGGNPPFPCECSIGGAMVVCRQCGAFCHDDCIGPQCICAICLIR
ncbi:PREDICTED: putative Polycomb group protein ASXL3 [Ceratosolen solmsi marchali]|uniref:Polycomb group protein ASXL3 n=1 Tax=Ceratosolen solmsi marchali TaxID=326594 RepID=A0AAJ6YWS1_9HYME|nr:PREDICTED: putative Polycomb group protein ASXL3 [Ceratosolen solmsi marchali]